MLRIQSAQTQFSQEPLKQAFAFKGKQIQSLWQVAVRLKGPAGSQSIGLGVQSVLWSDVNVFEAHSESGGDELMSQLTQFACAQVVGKQFADPIAMLHYLLPLAWQEGKRLTGREDLRLTFVLNALVALDFAAWLLYAQQNKMANFKEMLPQTYRSAMSQQHQRLLSLPTLGHGSSDAQIQALLKGGYPMLKIKIGAPGAPDQMLATDQAFLRQIHQQAGQSRIQYYLDANGRYDSIERVQALLNEADRIGALDRIVVLEEPFGQRSDRSVQALTDRGLLIAADESAQSVAETNDLLELGYNCLALKPVAKTLSMSLEIAKLAQQHNIPCFCADLTVNPVLLEWNKLFAAHLHPLPGLESGLVEANGWQYYQNWERLLTYHPQADASWISPHNGIWKLEEDYFTQSGGLWGNYRHYEALFSETE